MATTATRDVEELQITLGELPPRITAEQVRSHVVRAGWRTSGKELIDMPPGETSPIGTPCCSLRALVHGAYEGSLAA